MGVISSDMFIEDISAAKNEEFKEYKSAMGLVEDPTCQPYCKDDEECPALGRTGLRYLGVVAGTRKNAKGSHPRYAEVYGRIDQIWGHNKSLGVQVQWVWATSLSHNNGEFYTTFQMY